MRVDSGLRPRQPDDAPVALTIGNFDGVHRGHIALLAELDSAARRLQADRALLTFDPHPRCVLDPGNCPPTLSLLTEKEHLLERHGVDRLTVLPFTTAVSRWSADEFCERLRQSFDLRALVVGHDFALGHKRQGNVAFLRDWTSRYGIELHQVRPATDASGEPISSTRVRHLLHDGDLAGAASLLGHAYLIDAASAASSGRDAGTVLELAVPESKFLPAPGAYAAWVLSDGNPHAAIVQLGLPEGSGSRRPRLHLRMVDEGAPIPAGVVRMMVEQRLDGRGAHEAGTVSTGDPGLAEQAQRALSAGPPPA